MSAGQTSRVRGCSPVGRRGRPVRSGGVGEAVDLRGIRGRGTRIGARGGVVLDVEGGGRAGCGDRLAVRRVDHVAGGEHARLRRARVRPSTQMVPCSVRSS